MRNPHLLKGYVPSEVNTTLNIEGLSCGYKAAQSSQARSLNRSLKKSLNILVRRRVGNAVEVPLTRKFIRDRRLRLCPSTAIAPKFIVWGYEKTVEVSCLNVVTLTGILHGVRSSV
jgi:hypothetical protein